MPTETDMETIFWIMVVPASSAISTGAGYLGYISRGDETTGKVPSQALPQEI